MEIHICEYGCNVVATFQLKNKKWCCCKSSNSCVSVRLKNSIAIRKLYQSGQKISYLIDHPPLNNTKGWIPSETARKNGLLAQRSGKGRIGVGLASTSDRENIRRQRISTTLKNNPLAGGLRHGSGRGKQGWYKGYWCDSSWELAWVIYQLEHGIKFERNTQYFEYQYKNRIRKYYPDFLIDDQYYEIKGRRCFADLDLENKEKISQFNNKLIVLYEKDMQQYLTYTISKYGIKFYELYEHIKFVK